MSQETPRTDQPAATPPPIPGEDTAANWATADTAMTDTDRDMETNELHKPGLTCARCGQPFAPADDVRRRFDGGYEHEMCPPVEHPPD